MSYVSQYVNEEHEYSDSDCPSEGQTCQLGNMTEIYRRKHLQQSQNLRGSHYHTHQGYYNVPTRTGSCGCNYQVDPRYCCYRTNNNNEDGMNRSLSYLEQPPLPANYRMCHEKAPVSSKKYPVTVKTSRYYRNATMPLYKRPSTVYLPMDPALQRLRKQEHYHHPPPSLHQDPHYHPINDCCAAIKNRPTTAPTITTTRKTELSVQAIDSEGDVNSRLNDLENLLTKFEQDKGENDPVEMTAVADLSKILKPKVPASVKAKQQSSEIKCSEMKQMCDTSPKASPRKMGTSNKQNEPFDVFMRRIQQDEQRKDNVEKLKSDGTGHSPTADAGRKNGPYELHPKAPLDDNSAIELHKSKSYIVSLIDKALSKELGTVPGVKCSRLELLNMNPKKAIELVNRHTSPKICEKSISLQHDGSSDNKTRTKIIEEDCTVGEPISLEKTTLEPHYMKQLKQLRWSHLKHIQREAKRLADLERFLDSFRDID